jgi:hypothetical protein
MPRAKNTYLITTQAQVDLLGLISEKTGLGMAHLARSFIEYAKDAGFVYNPDVRLKVGYSKCRLTSIHDGSGNGNIMRQELEYTINLLGGHNKLISSFKALTVPKHVIIFNLINMLGGGE